MNEGRRKGGKIAGRHKRKKERRNKKGRKGLKTSRLERKK